MHYLFVCITIPCEGKFNHVSCVLYEYTYTFFCIQIMYIYWYSTHDMWLNLALHGILYGILVYYMVYYTM